MPDTMLCSPPVSPSPTLFFGLVVRAKTKSPGGSGADVDLGAGKMLDGSLNLSQCRLQRLCVRA